MSYLNQESNLTNDSQSQLNSSQQSGDSVNVATSSQSSQQPQQQQLPGSELLNNFPLPNPPDNNSSTPPRTLWMGDLDPWSDEDTIVQLWNSLNKRVLVKVIKAKRGTPAANLNTGHAGYCFVEFETYEDAQHALSLNGSQIPNSNRVFRLNWASGATLSSPIPQTPEFSLFVGDLSANTTEAHLLALFQSHFNSVKTVRVMTDPVTGASRCFGFVRFSDEEERRRALVEMQGAWLAGRPLRVALATPRNLASLTNGSNLSSSSGPILQQSGLGTPMMGSNGLIPNNSGSNGLSIVNSTQQQQLQSQGSNGLDPNNIMYMGPPPPGVPFPTFYPPPPPPQPFTDPTNTTVFVGGLASGIPEATLLSLFQPFGAIVNVKIPPGKGCGFVRFEKREDAERAIAGMQGFTIGGSRVRLSWGRAQNSIRSNPQVAAAVAAATGGYPMNDYVQPSLFYPPPPPHMNNGVGGLPELMNNLSVGDVPSSMLNSGNSQSHPLQIISSDMINTGSNGSLHNDHNGSNENDSNGISDNGEDSKLQDMYRAAAIGRMESLN